MRKTTNPERRRFERIGLADRAVHFAGPSGQCNCQLTDISLRGLLLQVDGDWYPDLQEQVELSIFLDEAAAARIELIGEVAHRDRDRGQIGIRILSADLDSIALLRRLIELNLDDGVRFERELHAMIEDHRDG